MIINDTKWNRRPTCVVYEWLTEKQIEEIKEFIIRTINVLRNNTKGKIWFSAYDLIGKENRDWKNTPLEYLYKAHLAHNAQQAYSSAAKDIGLFLLDILRKDTKNKYEMSYSIRTRNGLKIGIRTYCLY